MTHSPKQTGWTPGPISRGYTDDLRIEFERGSGSYIALLDKNGRPVALVPGRYVPGVIDPEMDANALLYAAAPELYEALANLLDAVEDANNNDDDVIVAANAALRAARPTQEGA